MQKCASWRYVWLFDAIYDTMHTFVSKLHCLTVYWYHSTHGISNQLKVVTGYIWRYAKTQNASLFFRGIRTWAADGAEERHLQILNSWGPALLGPVWPIKTIFLEGDPRYRDVSSTVVRRICADIRQRNKSGDTDVNESKNELARLVPECVIDRIVEAYQ